METSIRSRSNKRARVRLAVDIGGTFTDATFLDEETGEILISKEPTTPKDYTEGVMNSLNKAKVPMDNIGFFTHGTTVAINALIQGNVAKTALMTTKGFRDVLELGRSNRVQIYYALYRMPRPLIARNMRFEVSERIGGNGDVLKPLDENEVRDVVRKAVRQGAEAIAVCLINSYVNPSHERRIKEIVKEEFPQVSISVSTDLTREYREYERSSTVAINSCVMPIMEKYLSKLAEILSEHGYKRELYIMQSNGGIMTTSVAREKPVFTLKSGLAGGILGVQALSKLLGYRKTIGADMGGTSFDVEMITDGVPGVSPMMKINTPQSGFDGYPILAPSLDIHAIGAGGGSIAWIDEGGALKVGPRSAQAEPGPACYGKGGAEPTVTDANLILGRLDPGNFIGGEMPLYPDLSAKALKNIVERFHMDLYEAASGVLRIVISNMATAIRTMTVKRGLDPRDFEMIVFGGAGPMHGVAIADELQIPRVTVATMPGNFSAWGMLMADIRHDLVQTHMKLIDEVDLSIMNEIFNNLESKVKEILKSEGVPKENIQIIRGLDVRYYMQEHTLTVTVPSGTLNDAEKESVCHRFDELHEMTYLHSAKEEPKEMVSLRVAGLGIMKKPQLKEIKKGTEKAHGTALKHKRQVYFDSTGFVDCPIYDRRALLANNQISGPAVVQERVSTTLVPPEFSLKVDKFGHLLISK